jgi:CheY-like chemotaxis protein
MMQLASSRHSSPAPQTQTVLVVEDEELVRETISAELRDAGFVVLEAGTAEQGLDVLEEMPVGVLFTDIRLPGKVDGWELAERARSLHPDLPVIYATGYSAEHPRLVPDSIFLRKPYLPSAVIAAITKLTGPIST